jgi:hypothetical protein
MVFALTSNALQVLSSRGRDDASFGTTLVRSRASHIRTCGRVGFRQNLLLRIVLSLDHEAQP